MAYVHSFGNGYYALETEGVTVTPDVQRRIARAFNKAMAVPDEAIRVNVSDKPRSFLSVHGQELSGTNSDSDE